MRQQDATKTRPFYSVGYQYERNPWTLWSLNRYGMKNPLRIGGKGTTQQGTDSFDEAKREADKLVNLPGISSAVVSMTEDCYNHKTVYAAGKDAAKWLEKAGAQ